MTYLKQYGQITGYGSPLGKPGLDVDLKVGDPVTAPQSGKVVYAGEKGGFGNVVQIQDKTGKIIQLAHLDSADVKKGQFISAGQLVGKGGKTGSVIPVGGGDGSHLDITVYDKSGKKPALSAKEVEQYVNTNMTSVKTIKNLNEKIDGLRRKGRTDTQILDIMGKGDFAFRKAVEKARQMGKNDRDLLNKTSVQFSGVMPTVPSVPTQEQMQKSPESGTGVVEKKPSLLEIGARILSPKSVEGFGETLGTAMATPLLKKQEEQETSENIALQNQIIKRLQDPNVSREQKERLAKLSQELGLSTIEQVDAIQKTKKDVAAEALGTLGTMAFGAKPSKNIITRLGFATAFGAGAGTKKGLEQDKEAIGVIKDTVKGGAFGLATGLLFEGIFAGIKKTAPLFGKNTYNKELQPDANELAASIKRNADTFGTKVRNVVDDRGKPVYVGGYKKMLEQAKKEVSSNGNKLNSLLKQADKADDLTISRDKIAGDIIKKLQDQYGKLTSNQLKTVKMFVNKMPNEMSRVDMLKNKRLYDSLMSKTDWNKIILGDTQASFAGQVKFMLRDNLKKAIENSTDDAVVKGLNSRMGIGMEVRDLVAKQLANRTRMKVNASGINPFSRLISRIWDDALFAPALTTRASQATKVIGQMVPGRAMQTAELGVIEASQ